MPAIPFLSLISNGLKDIAMRENLALLQPPQIEPNTAPEPLLQPPYNAPESSVMGDLSPDYGLPLPLPRLQEPTISDGVIRRIDLERLLNTMDISPEAGKPFIETLPVGDTRPVNEELPISPESGKPFIENLPISPEAGKPFIEGLDINPEAGKPLILSETDPTAKGGEIETYQQWRERVGDYTAERMERINTGDENRLSVLDRNKGQWQTYVKDNPILKNNPDTVIIYRSTIGKEINAGDYVYLNRKMALAHQKELGEEGAKIVSREIFLDDIVGGQDGTEFIFSPRNSQEQGYSKLSPKEGGGEETVEVYHAGELGDNMVDRPTHFGTEEQAKERLANLKEWGQSTGKETIKPYTITGKFKRIEDLGSDPTEWKKAQLLAEREGYTGLVYKNAFESDNDVDSYVIFSKSQLSRDEDVTPDELSILKDEFRQSTVRVSDKSRAYGWQSKEHMKSEPFNQKKFEKWLNSPEALEGYDKTFTALVEKARTKLSPKEGGK